MAVKQELREKQRVSSRKYYQEHREEQQTYHRKYWQEHKEERKAYARKHYQEHKEEAKLKSRKYWQQHREEHKAYAKEYRQEHREEVNAKLRKYRQTHREEINAKASTSNRDKKLKVIELLGGRCRNCGLTDARVLQVNHINGDGKKDRASYSSHAFYTRILSNKRDTKDLELLCANCNILYEYEVGRKIWQK